MYNEEHKHINMQVESGGRPRRGFAGRGGGYWWWWCKAVTEIEGDGVAAAGCSVHCQSGMINEWRPQLSLTFGEPHRTSAELSALWQGQSWTTNYFAITKVGCQLNPSHSLRQGQANFSFTYTHTHTLSRPWSCMDTQTHIQVNKQAHTYRNTCLCGHVHKADYYTRSVTHSRIHTQAWGLDKIELTPPLLVVATPCRWHILRKAGQAGEV